MPSIRPSSDRSEIRPKDRVPVEASPVLALETPGRVPSRDAVARAGAVAVVEPADIAPLARPSTNNTGDPGTPLPRLSDLIRSTPSEITQARRRLHAKAAGIAGLAFASYVTLVWVATGILLQIVCLIALAVAVTTVGTGIMHDANHGAFARSRRANRVVAYSADLVGASSWVWRFKHNTLHHGHPNLAGVDHDVEQAPFARLAPSQAWHPWHRYQHVYLWGLYGFLALKWFLVSDIVALRRGGFGTNRFRRPARRVDVVAAVSGKVVHVGWAVLLPLTRHPWWGVLAFYVVGSWLVGFTLATVFQLAHCTDAVSFPDPERKGVDDGFVLRQLQSTANIECRTVAIGGFLRWLMGGLDHQIEHHLAPGVPHTAYPVIAVRLQRLCAERGLPYAVHPSVWAALLAHGRWLRSLGQRPSDAM